MSARRNAPYVGRPPNAPPLTVRLRNPDGSQVMRWFELGVAVWYDPNLPGDREWSLGHFQEDGSFVEHVVHVVRVHGRGRPPLPASFLQRLRRVYGWRS